MIFRGYVPLKDGDACFWRITISPSSVTLRARGPVPTIRRANATAPSGLTLRPPSRALLLGSRRVRTPRSTKYRRCKRNEMEGNQKVHMEISPNRAHPCQITAGAPLERRTHRDQDPTHITKDQNRDQDRDHDRITIVWGGR